MLETHKNSNLHRMTLIKKEGNVLLRVIVENKTEEAQKVRVRISHDGESDDQKVNLQMPDSEVCDPLIFSKDKKCLFHIQKINPQKPFSKIRVEVTAAPKSYLNKQLGGAQGSSDLFIGSGTGTQYNINIIDTVNVGYGMIGGPQDNVGYDGDYVQQDYFKM
ncbi:UNKNOWN [Stylonychia lemnae]|uniref:Uncharacterized protein n=1 Tax=Stylonychia lemnae TaxID=5949 RepID=A0A078B942_STYLE|nr:UNKNOWN [Stylonychia lemnae]|eukprot:CDW91035.1 UNKNOWN [Stylonychia lemnae]